MNPTAQQRAWLPLSTPRGAEQPGGAPPSLPCQAAVALLAHLLRPASAAGHGGAEAEAAGAEGPAAAGTAALRGHRTLIN